jgi:hypothetical protein
MKTWTSSLDVIDNPTFDATSLDVGSFVSTTRPTEAREWVFLPGGEQTTRHAEILDVDVLCWIASTSTHGWGWIDVILVDSKKRRLINSLDVTPL